jgi:hypothetical protein
VDFGADGACAGEEAAAACSERCGCSQRILSFLLTTDSAIARDGRGTGGLDQGRAAVEPWLAPRPADPSSPPAALPLCSALTAGGRRRATTRISSRRASGPPAAMATRWPRRAEFRRWCFLLHGRRAGRGCWDSPAPLRGRARWPPSSPPAADVRAARVHHGGIRGQGQKGGPAGSSFLPPSSCCRAQNNRLPWVPLLVLSREPASPLDLAETGGNGIFPSSLQEPAAGVLTPKSSWRSRSRLFPGAGADGLKQTGAVEFAM